ncbi:MAG: GNAT family N-acetyltransferase [Solirubrobacteraceae bacterium]|jgi:GNAT superfamily N-acetyltransferase
MTDSTTLSARRAPQHDCEPEACEAGSRSACGSVAAELRIRRLRDGETWRPYNYGAVDRRGQVVGERRYAPRAGYAVIGAYSGEHLLGCAEVSVADAEQLASSVEYGGGDMRNGAFFYEHADHSDRFLLLHSLWVDPAHQGAGFGDILCEELAAFGLPTYAEFAQAWVCTWFWRRFCPAVFQAAPPA